MHRGPYYRLRPENRPELPPDRVLILGGVLRKLVAIHAYYEARGERVGGVILHENERDRFDATVSDADHKLFHVKLLAPDEHLDVREFGREEML
jgi:hypothetical protein